MKRRGWGRGRAWASAALPWCSGGAGMGSRSEEGAEGLAVYPGVNGGGVGVTNWNDTSPASVGGCSASVGGCSASGERQEARRERRRWAGGGSGLLGRRGWCAFQLSNFPACRKVGRTDRRGGMNWNDTSPASAGSTKRCVATGERAGAGGDGKGRGAAGLQVQVGGRCSGCGSRSEEVVEGLAIYPGVRERQATRRGRGLGYRGRRQVRGRAQGGGSGLGGWPVSGGLSPAGGWAVGAWGGVRFPVVLVLGYRVRGWQEGVLQGGGGRAGGRQGEKVGGCGRQARGPGQLGLAGDGCSGGPGPDAPTPSGGGGCGGRG